jgi:hypothetical protein
MSDKIRSTFLALGVLSPGRERMTETLLRQASPPVPSTTGTFERKTMKPVVSKRQRGLVTRLKSLGMVLLLGIFLAACSTETPEDLESQAVKKALPHFPLNGRIHWLDPELYWELQKISIQSGGTGSPREVDALYDSRR